MSYGQNKDYDTTQDYTGSDFGILYPFVVMSSCLTRL